MLWGLLPSAASRLREILLGRRRERNLRTSRFSVWFEKEKRLHSLMFLGGSCALAGIILFCSFFTIGTTVSYDGQVLGRLASKLEAETVRKDLESGDIRLLKTDFTIPERSVDMCTLKEVPPTAAATAFMEMVRRGM